MKTVLNIVMIAVSLVLAAICWMLVLPVAATSWGMFNKNISDVRRMSDPAYQKNGIDWSML